MKIKTRIKSRHFMDGTTIRAAYTVECLVNRKWIPLGDDSGICRFDSQAEAQAAADKASVATIEQ